MGDYSKRISTFVDYWIGNIALLNNYFVVIEAIY